VAVPRLLAAVLAVAASAALAQPQEADEDALTAQGIAGEILDTAVEHCRRGERAQALSMFTAIREQLDPPPGILRVVDSLEATGCNGTLLVEVRGARVQVSAGWDSNVSQGITARTLTLGGGGNAVDVTLDETYRPRSSAFVQAAVEYSQPLPVGGLALRGSLAHRHHESAHKFDLSSGAIALSREFRFSDSMVRAQVEHSQVWLGARHFQRAQGAGLQWLGTHPAGAWLAHAATTRVDYLTQPTQDSRQYEAGLLLERRVTPGASVYAGLTLQYDEAAGMRAGGDRRGYQVRAGALMQAHGWQLRPQASLTHWTSADLFAPTLIDVRRRNRLAQVILQAEKALSPHTSLILELNGRWARDSVALYTYRAHTFMATWARRF
jgi:hypothetical protein